LQETDTFLDTSIFLPLPAGQIGGQIPEASWILLRLQPGTLLDYMTNKLETNLERIDIISRPEMLKTIDDQLFGLLRGGGFDVAALLVVIGVLLVTGALFALSVNERKREFGLLKAMGARNTSVFKLIIIEAAILGGLGGILGIVFSALWLLFASAGFASADFASASFLGSVFYKMILTLVLTIAVGILTALYPALLAGRIEPYAAIRSGE
jgi:putative ABC transport system permease protein